MAEIDGIPACVSEARAIGAKLYFTGSPCRHGHIAKRFTCDQSCVECGRVRALKDYHVNHAKRTAARKARCAADREALSKRRAERRLREPDYAAACRRRNNESRLRHLANSRARAARKYADGTPQYKLKHNSLSSLRRSLKGLGGKRWHEAVGYTAEELKAHIERQFLKGMTWENYGKEWHVDHIVPVSSFDCTSVDDPAFKACWALTNLRPLWAKDNISKSARRTYLL